MSARPPTAEPAHKLSRKHKKLLQLIKEGHDSEAAASGAGLDVSAARDPSLQAHIQDALRTGTALLRSKLTELALTGNDVRALENLLARREGQVQQETMRVERSIISGVCPHCRKPLYKLDECHSAFSEDDISVLGGYTKPEAAPINPVPSGNGESKPEGNDETRPKRSYIVLGGI